LGVVEGTSERIIELENANKSSKTGGIGQKWLIFVKNGRSKFRMGGLG
jgi:hypothetical protein